LDLRCNDELKGNKEYFETLNKALDKPDALRSIYWYFKQYDITEWDFRNVPKTKYHQTIIEHTNSPIKLFLETFTLQHISKLTHVIAGTELLKEFKKWSEETGYKCEDNMNEGVLLKKFKTETDLPAEAIMRGDRTKKGYKQMFDISI
jgi:hypothetical protein